MLVVYKYSVHNTYVYTTCNSLYIYIYVYVYVFVYFHEHHIVMHGWLGRAITVIFYLCAHMYMLSAHRTPCPSLCICVKELAVVLVPQPPLGCAGWGAGG